jgi:hypothetical protein
MKAILRWGAGLFGLLLLTPMVNAQGYNWATAVTKCPFPQAPDMYNSGFYLMDWCGRVTGPHYYLVPPCPPFNGARPGRNGQGVQQAQLPNAYPHGLGLANPGMIQPMQPFQQFAPFQAMTPVGSPPPHGPPMGGGAYPVHPFTRSPRDFFMWGDMMEEERARGNRPFPVP